MTIGEHRTTDQSGEPVDAGSDNGGTSGPATSSFLQMFLEARPPRDNVH